MSQPTFGLRLSSTDESVYTSETVGDIIMYAGNSNQSIFIGQSNQGKAGIELRSNLDVNFGRDIASVNMNATGSLMLHMGSISPTQIDTSIEATIARNSVAASNHSFLMGTITNVSDWTNVSGVTSFDTTYGADNSTFTSNVVINGDLQVDGTLDTTSINFAHSNVTIYTSDLSTSNIIVNDGVITIGSNENVSYPLHVQTIGSNNTSIVSAGDIQALSDETVKTNILPIPGALGKMDLIGGYTFNWLRDPEGMRSAGVLAQEMETVLPEVVNMDDVSGKLNVSYGNISALLIQAIKELSHRTTAMTLTTTEISETIDVLLPDRKQLTGDDSASPWRVACISASDEDADAASAFVDVSADGTRLIGRCEVPGKYAILAQA